MKEYSTLADDVQNRLLKLISARKLRPGDVLPKELELVESLKVSRHIIREGLNRLQAMGLVEPRKRRGTVFCRPHPFIGFQHLAEAGMFSDEDRRNFMELRVAMELGMCDFIYQRRTEEKIKELKKYEGISENGKYDLKNELNFHTCLMSIANNEAADNIREVLLMAFEEKKDILVPSHKTPTSHKDIREALESGTFLDFYTTMRAHLATYINTNNPQNTQNTQEDSRNVES